MSAAEVQVDFWLCGQLRLRRGGEVESLGVTLRHEILALLLYHANTAVPIDQIASSVWPRKGNTDDAIRSYITRARQLVAGLDCSIEAQPRSYLLKVDPMRVDVLRFGSLMEEAHRRDGERRRQCLDEAMSLCPTDVMLSGFSHDWVRSVRQHFRPKWRVAALLRNRIWLEEGEYERLLAAVDWKLIFRSLDQRMAEDYLRALYHSGHGTEANKHFEVFAERLAAAKTAVQPSLRRLGAQMASGDPALEAAPRTAAASIDMLPPLTGWLEGRHADIRAMQAHAARTGAVRLIGIYGGPGIGKTSLAITYAHQAKSRYPGGVLFARLAHARSTGGVDIDGILEAFLRALGVRPENVPVQRQDRVTRYQELLRRRRMLVVLDNVRSTEDIVPLLPSEPGSLVLVTSRNRLTAMTARYAALPVVLGPIDEAASIRLLGHLAGGHPGWSVGLARQLARVCSGHPLALCLAAARLATHPEEPVDALMHDLARPGARIAALDRYAESGESVVDVIGWSYQALDKRSAWVLRLLALSPWATLDLPAVAQMAGMTDDAVRPVLAALVRAHLAIEPVADRFSLLDLITEYASAVSMNVDDEATRTAALDRLYDHYREMSRAAAHALWPLEVEPGSGPSFDVAAARAWLDVHSDELVAAAQHPLTLDRPGYTIDISSSLTRYLDHGGFLNQAIALQGAAVGAARRSGDDAAAALALGRLGAVLFRRGQVDAAETALVDARDLSARAGHGAGEATALGNLGRIAAHRGSYAEAIQFQLAALRIFRAIGARLAVARTLTNLAIAHRSSGDLSKALHHLRQARRICVQLDARDAGARVRGTMADILRIQGRTDEAERLYQEAMDGFRELGDRVGEASAMSRLGMVRSSQGRHAQAIELINASLSIFEDIGHDAGYVDALLDLGAATLAAGRPAEASRLHRKALASAASLGDSAQVARAHAGLAADYESGDADLARSHATEAIARFGDLGMRAPADLVALSARLAAT